MRSAATKRIRRVDGLKTAELAGQICAIASPARAAGAIDWTAGQPPLFGSSSRSVSQKWQWQMGTWVRVRTDRPSLKFSLDGR